MPPIYDEIRQAIEASEKSRYRISLETSIGQPQLCGFMKGDKGLSVEALEKLADCLSLVITAQPKDVSPRDRSRNPLKTGRKGR